MESLTNPENWAALATLTALEVVLGIDNIIFISILTSRLPKERQGKARTVGLLVAMMSRIALLFSISLLMRLTRPLFSLLDHSISGKDLILIVGGLFLLGKSTLEIHHKLEGEETTSTASGKTISFSGVLLQVLLLDVVFSIDSVVTAIGMAREVGIMVVAVVISVFLMMFFAGHLGRFVEKHPTLKILALSFLILIGVSLIGEGLGMHIPKGYIYFAMAFSVLVEMINLKLRTPHTSPLKLRETPPTHSD